MELTNDDLQRQCAPQHAAFVQCAQKNGAEAASGSMCRRQREALERCATSHAQLVRSINEGCSAEHAAFTMCVTHARDANRECVQQQDAYWQCAQRHATVALTND
jgi:hypothetical protein